MSQKGDIELVIADIDGCILKEIGAPFDLIRINNFREMLEAQNLRITFASGRPKPFVEAVMELFDSQVPAVCENGGIIFTPSPYRIHYFDEEKINFVPKIREIIKNNISDLKASIEPAKEASIGVMPDDFEDDETVNKIFRRIGELENSFPCSVHYSVASNVVNVMPDGISKLEAIREVLRIADVDSSKVLAVGDASGDIPFMNFAGFSACPANSEDDVKNMADYVSTYEDIAGVIDIINHFSEVP